MNIKQMKFELNILQDSIDRLEFFAEGGERMVGEGLDFRTIKMEDEDVDRAIGTLIKLKRQYNHIVKQLQLKTS